VYSRLDIDSIVKSLDEDIQYFSSIIIGTFDSSNKDGNGFLRYYKRVLAMLSGLIVLVVGIIALILILRGEPTDAAISHGNETLFHMYTNCASWSRYAFCWNSTHASHSTR